MKHPQDKRYSACCCLWGADFLAGVSVLISELADSKQNTNHLSFHNRQHDSLASAAFMEFWTLSILKTSNFLPNTFEAIGTKFSEIVRRQSA